MSTNPYKKIVVTGGAGFIGSNIAIQLKRDFNCDVIVLDNLNRRGSEINVTRLKNNGVEFVHGDVRFLDDLEQVGQFDLLIECSAEPSVKAGYDSNPCYLIQTNLIGAINCLEAIRKQNADIIFMSTSRVYPVALLRKLKLNENNTRYNLDEKQIVPGVTTNGVTEEFSLKGNRTLYGATKLSAELLLSEYIDAYNIKGVINRCGVITGPWQMGKVDQGFVVLWVARHVFDKELSYIGYDGCGKQVRDILHIDDLYEMIKHQIMNMDKYNKKIFNVGGGIERSVSLQELTAATQHVTGKKVKITKKPSTHETDIPYYVTDISKVSDFSDWQPKISIEQTIEDIYKWIVDNKSSIENILR